MIKYFCDKCGTEVGQMSAQISYSISRHKEMVLCSPCQIAYDKAIAEAEKLFFDNANGGGTHD